MRDSLTFLLFIVNLDSQQKNVIRQLWFIDWVKLSGNLSRFDYLELLRTHDFREMFGRFAYP